VVADFGNDDMLMLGTEELLPASPKILLRSHKDDLLSLRYTATPRPVQDFQKSS
jgi:hypothetical protein